MSKISRILPAAVSLLSIAGLALGQDTAGALKQGFEDPPHTARPPVWWHWMNANIPHEYLHLCLEWMHRIGIAGFQNFDAALSTPQVVPTRLAYMTPEWKAALDRKSTRLNSSHLG